MSDWNPALYMQYSAERSRPAAELLARIQLEHVSSVVDLGCGPGNGCRISMNTNSNGSWSVIISFYKSNTHFRKMARYYWRFRACS